MTISDYVTIDLEPARSLLSRLRMRDISIRLEGGRVKVRGAGLTEADKQAMLSLRGAVLAVLREEASRGLSVPLLEVSKVAVRHWVEFAAPHSLFCALQGSGAGVVLTTSKRRHAELVAAGKAVFSPLETLAMLSAAESYLAGPDELAEWVDRKERRKGWVLTAKIACGGVPPRAEDSLPNGRSVWWGGADVIPGHWITEGCTLGWLAAHYGLDLLEVTSDADIGQEAA